MTRSVRYAIIPAVMASLAGMTLLAVSRDVRVAVLAVSVALVFFGGIAIVFARGARSNPRSSSPSTPVSLLPLVFALAVTGQITLALGVTRIVPAALLLAMGVVLLLDQLARRRERREYGSTEQS